MFWSVNQELVGSWTAKLSGIFQAKVQEVHIVGINRSDREGWAKLFLN